MRALVQRVNGAQVRIDGEVVGAIERGLCALVGVTHSDDADIARKLAAKVWGLRVFPDGPGSAPERQGGGSMNVSVGEVGGAVLVVSQFTLYADTMRGRRPSWAEAAPPAVAEPLVEAFIAALRALGATVATGRFGANMQVALVNDGPVTVLLEVPATAR